MKPLALPAPKRLAMLVLGSLLAACQQAPDFSKVELERQKAIHRDDLFQATATNDKVMVASTAHGAMLSSADLGQSWNRQTLAGASILSIATCPSGRFAALDFYRKVWIGNSAGQDWTAHPVTTAQTGDNVMAIACDPQGALWVVGSQSRIHVSRDQGATWQAQSLGEDAILTTVQFTDARHAHALGEFGTHLVTDNAGATWQKKAGLPAGFYPYATVFKTEKEAWTAGVAGVILHTADGGSTWQPQTNEAGVPIYSLVRWGGSLFGLGFGGQMVVLRGQRWVRYEHGHHFPAYLSAGAALGSRALLVAGAGGTLQPLLPATPK